MSKAYFRYVITGYKRSPDYGFIIVPDEAEIVKQIYSLYLDGYGTTKIADILNEQEILNEDGSEWKSKKIRYLLSNERYIGDLLLQKNYSSDHLTKKKVKNTGQKPQYYVENNHEPIISKDIFIAVQAEIKRRSEKHYKGKHKPYYPFTGILVCGNCGKNYKRKVTATQVVWICSTYNSQGKAACASKQIPETTLIQETLSVLGTDKLDEKIIKQKISCIIVNDGNNLIFKFNDGTQYIRTWKDRSRSESWTPEMKEAARQKMLHRGNQ